MKNNILLSIILVNTLFTGCATKQPINYNGRSDSASSNQQDAGTYQRLSAKQKCANVAGSNLPIKCHVEKYKGLEAMVIRFSTVVDAKQYLTASYKVVGAQFCDENPNHFIIYQVTSESISNAYDCLYNKTTGWL